jgi:transcriptional regulator with XRE-family HTH domain
MEAKHSEIGASKLGELLKRQRHALNLSQRDIARKLHYRHFNFICMIENGTSQIPFSRIPDIVTAYELPPTFLLIIIRERYPDAWRVMSAINIALPEVFMSAKEDVELSLDKAYASALDDYKIK